MTFFFRWATDRLHDKNGIICFVTPNSFIHKGAFDGVRASLIREFTSIYTFDLGGSVKDNPKLSGTTHNVFGIPDGVSITLLIRNRLPDLNICRAQVFYSRVDEYWRKERKLLPLLLREIIRCVVARHNRVENRGAGLLQRRLLEKLGG